MIVKEPSREQQLLIRRECNEDVNTTDRDLEIIREWLRQQPHLPDTCDDEVLLNFLRNCKFSLEKTKKKLDRYFTVKAAFPEFYSNRDRNNKELQRVFDHAYVQRLQITSIPQLTPQGRRVNVARAIPCDEDTFNLTNFIKVVFLFTDIYLKVDKTGVTGEVFILDLEDLALKHVSQVTPNLARKFFLCVQEALPCKIKELHLIRASSLVDYAIKIGWPFLKEKLRNRLHIHHDLETLFDYVPKELIPEEMGGTGGKFPAFKLQDAFDEYSEWLREYDTAKADESKRPKENNWSQDLYGLDGSFKQLTVD